MTRAFFPSALTIACLVGCAHSKAPAQAALLARGDCGELLRAADAARARSEPDLATEMASGCKQDKLDALVAGAAEPAEALFWCGRARAAGGTCTCSPAVVGELTSRLHPRLTLGPPDEAMAADPMLAFALQQLGKELNLEWNPSDPDVIVGKLGFIIDHTTTPTLTTVPDAKGKKQRVSATQHRILTRAEAQVELLGKTRTLRASDEVRDLTWDAADRLSVAAKFEPQIPPEEELKKRAALAWLRALGKALASAPPEGVDVTDVKGCAAYGLSLNLTTGDANAAASGNGDPLKVAACEKLLGEPAGAGIPVP